MIKNKYFATIAVLVVVISILAMPTIYAAENSGNNQQQEINSMENEVLKLVNVERAKYNLNPLILDNDLVSAAKIRSVEIITSFEHERPDGRSITTISSKVQGENLAKGYPTAKQVMDALMKSPPHKANILNPYFTTIGIGYTKLNHDPKGSTHYLVQLFGGSKAAEITLMPSGKLAVSSVSSSKITLKWNSQSSDNANGYQVFRYNPKTKSYSLIKTIKGNKINTYTDTGLTSVTSYSYKVRSYLKVGGQRYYGQYSSVVKVITKPVTPSSLKLSFGKKRATVSWKKVSKATGYQIYKSTSKNGKYSLKKTITSSFTLKFTDKNLKSKKTYYYKIRSYTTVNKVKIYSNFSPVKSIKVK